MIACALLAGLMAAAPADGGGAKPAPATLTLKPLEPLKTATAKPPRELITIEGMPSLMAFIDRDQVGVRQGTRFWAWSLSEPLTGDVPDAFTVPGRPDQIIICMNRDCVRGAPCAKGRAADRSRSCVWLAPKCEQAALLAGRYARIERSNDGLNAEVYSAAACLPGDGPEPKWSSRDDGTRGSSGVLRGELETHACAPPTWKRALGAFLSSGDNGDVAKSDVPACGR
jgi:hypothetical protein